MGIGASVLLIGLGAILKWAVEFEVAGIEVGTVGVILMIVGVVGLIASTINMRRDDLVVTDRRDSLLPREPRRPYF